MNPPDHISIEAELDANINQRKWNPKNVRLSDAGVIYALLTLPADYRIRYLAYDFDSRGDVRKERVPKAPTVAFYWNNQRTLVAWKGVYVFTGGGQQFFEAGLVVASSHVKTFDTLNVQLTEYESVSGYQKMGLLFGFNTLIGPGADAADTNEAIQQDQWPCTAWKNKLSPDAEFKRRTSDFINFIRIQWGAFADPTKENWRGAQTKQFTIPITRLRSTLWAELAGVESPPKYWELFTAVGTMETMHQRWRHNHMAVKLVQHNISPSEATVIRDLMQTLSPKLRFLLLGIGVDEDRLALENAFSYNSAMAYMNFYTYFRTLALPKAETPQPSIKLEQQEESDSGPRQYAEIQEMNFWA
ncbi:hypothetical protein N7519_002974 [Penicillium mononematosum]|uniref:uncharacterized protein n=1 Tax=Penicillium mononematosum TaxID=268346 RepID=UPI002547E544|nr:uncharacterized protein N7519_002974 [Penicillium mononematosum]KAJ6188066.1 hypothetical protein N7519_002974 [Penicillium mononematosum]